MTRKGSLIGLRKAAAHESALRPEGRLLTFGYGPRSGEPRRGQEIAAGYRDAGGQTGPHRVRQSAEKPVRARAFIPDARTHGFTVAPSPESGHKITRFGPFSSQCRAAM